MKARKSRSTIDKIKDSLRVRKEDAAYIQKLFVTMFNLHFQSMQSPPNIYTDLPNMVSSEENENLITPSEDYKVCYDFRKRTVYRCNVCGYHPQEWM